MTEQNRQCRRDFIRTVSLYSGTTLFASSVPWLSVINARDLKESASANDKVNIGFIGVGSRGKCLLLNMQTIPGVNITAVCDNYEPNYQEAIKLTEGKAKAFYDYRKMLEMNDLDAVVIATPLHEHAYITIDALNAGLHVFCEKSMARHMEDCKKMVETQRKTGNILQIGHQRMYNIKYIKALEMIHNGMLGKITQIRAYWHRNNDWRREVPEPHLEKKINWRLYKEFSCGLMTELASHQIQVANWALEEHPCAVMGSGSINYWHDGREVDDNVNLVYVYPSGTHLVYDSMISNRHYGLEEQIMGPKGTMECEIGKVYSENPPPAPGIMQLINNIEHGIFDNIPIGGASWVPETAVNNKGEFIVDDYPLPDDTQLQMEGFVEVVKKGKPVPGLLEQGYQASIASLLGFQAIEKGEIIKWPDEYRIDTEISYK